MAAIRGNSNFDLWGSWCDFCEFYLRRMQNGGGMPVGEIKIIIFLTLHLALIFLLILSLLFGHSLPFSAIFCLHAIFFDFILSFLVLILARSKATVGFFSSPLFFHKSFSLVLALLFTWEMAEGTLTKGYIRASWLFHTTLYWQMTNYIYILFFFFWLNKAIFTSKRHIKLNILFQVNANCDPSKELFCTQTPGHFRRLHKAFHLNA